MKEKRYTLPDTWGPANEEEAIARIEAIEAENEEYTDIEDFERKLTARYTLDEFF